MSFSRIDNPQGRVVGAPQHQDALEEIMLEEIPLDDDGPDLANANARVGYRQAVAQPTNLFTARGTARLEVAQQALQNLPGADTVTPGVPDALPIVVRHPETGIAMEIPRAMLKGLNTTQNLEQLTDILQNKIENGLVTLNNVLGGNQPPPGTPENVSNLMWYLQVAAEHKSGAPFTQGALSIDDPYGRLRDYLDNVQDPNRDGPDQPLLGGEAYQRLSTHVSGFQTLPNGFPRGLDLYNRQPNLRDALPYGKQTILYQTMGTQSNNEVRGMPREMLLLKMEEHGCYSRGQQREGRGPVRQERNEDRAAFWGHVKTTIKSYIRRLLGNNSPEGSRKERLSSGMTKAYDKLSSWKLFGTSLPREARNILAQNKPTSSAGGVRIMSANIENAIDHLRQTPGNERHIQKLEAFRQKYLSNPQWDHQDVRIGNEVILTLRDLNLPERVEIARGPVAQSIARPFDKQQFINTIQVDAQAIARGDDGEDVQRDGVTIARQFVVDSIDRHSYQYVVNGRELDNRSGLQALRAAFPDDNVSLLEASRLITQNIFGSIFTAEMGQNGPWPDTQVGSHPDTTVNQASLSLTDNGSVRLKITQSARVQSFVSLNADPIIYPDVDSSPYIFREVEIEIPPGNQQNRQIRVIDYNVRLQDAPQ